MANLRNGKQEFFLHGLVVDDDIIFEKINIEIKKMPTNGDEITRLGNINPEFLFSDSILIINSLDENIECLINILRIATNTGIWYRYGIYTEYSANSGGAGFGSRLEGYSIPDKIKITLENKENFKTKVEELIKYKETTQLFKEVMCSNDKTANNNDIQVLFNAVEFYNEALLSKKIEDKISKIIICLEIIYVAEGNELSHRLSYRVAKFASIFNLDPLNVRKDTKTAYSIRSKYLHEGKTDQKTKDENSKLFQKLLVLSKVSLLYFCEALSKDYDRKQLLQLLDDSLLRLESEKELRRLANFTIDKLRTNVDFTTKGLLQ